MPAVRDPAAAARVRTGAARPASGRSRAGARDGFGLGESGLGQHRRHRRCRAGHASTRERGRHELRRRACSNPVEGRADHARWPIELGASARAASAKSKRPGDALAPNMDLRAANGSAGRRASARDSRDGAGSGRPSARSAAIVCPAGGPPRPAPPTPASNARWRKPRFAPGADQLHRLHQELDLTDAARAQFEVLGHLALLHLGIDHRLHFAQAVERGVVEVAAIDEWPQRFPAGARQPRGRRRPGAP